MIGNITSKLGNAGTVVESITGMELQCTICKEESKFAEIIGQELKLNNLAFQMSSELLTHLLCIVAFDHRRINTYAVMRKEEKNLPLVMM